jgi:hypothetical protein
LAFVNNNVSVLLTSVSIYVIINVEGDYAKKRNENERYRSKIGRRGGTGVGAAE